MAKRRMLSIDFCESDHFYMLSPVTRMLYVHFILNADDDGFVDKWRSVMRCARIERKFYTPLVEKEYVIEINEGLILITHWHRHNTIRADRYVPTAYAKALRGFTVDEEKRYIKAGEDLLVTQCVPQSIEDKIRVDNNISDKSIKETEKNSPFTNNNQTSIHTSSASQKHPTDDIFSFYSTYATVSDPSPDERLISALKTAICLYFMKKYQSLESKNFIDDYERRGWQTEDEIITQENYKYYVDRWMEGKGNSTPAL